MPESSWQRVLRVLLEAEELLRTVRSQTPVGRDHRASYRNGHPLDPPVRHLRERIDLVRGHIDNV
jgi:hypothetical protein